MKKIVLLLLATFSMAVSAFAGTGQIGSVGAEAFPNTRWYGVDPEDGLKLDIKIDANNSWIAVVVKDGKKMSLKGTALEVRPIFGGVASGTNPMVVVFKLDNGEVALPPLGLILENGQLRLEYDTLSLTRKK